MSSGHKQVQVTGTSQVHHTSTSRMLLEAEVAADTAAEAAAAEAAAAEAATLG